MNKKVILMILDGWGIAIDKEVSAIDKAKTPYIDSLYKKYPYSKLEASGLAVGLPEGQMGNSEVGHMNIGAGRIVYQMLVRINNAVEEKTINQNKELLKAFEYAKNNNKKVHLIGLLSDGGVHSHINHIKGLLSAASEFGLTDVFIHVFTDGRDTDPKRGIEYIKELQAHTKTTSGKIASVTGRYYAMDRDKRWERVKLAYDVLIHGKGKHTQNIEKAILDSYNENITDEFIKPIVVTGENAKPIAKIESDDVVLCFNFRTDRGRQITMALTQESFPEQEMKPLSLYYLTMTQYDERFKNVHILYHKQNLSSTLGEILAKNNRKQIRIAETEKYPHVTFFFRVVKRKSLKEKKDFYVLPLKWLLMIYSQK